MAGRVVVVGGGISGLAVARALLRSGSAEVCCLEAEARPGGNVRTEREGGFLLEWGPTAFLDNAPATLDLARELGLETEVVRADPSARRRFVFRAGRLHRVPGGPFSLVGSGVLPWASKLRLLLEPFVPRRKDPGDESVFEFARRRIGTGAAEILVDAMVSGIYAGDARRLSLPACFPRMRELETEYGSLVRAMLALVWSRRAKGGPSGPSGTLTSFRGGLETLPRAIARELGPALRTGRKATGVGHMGIRGFRVFLDEGAPLDAAAVVLACPAWNAAELVSSMDGSLASTLASIPSAPIAVVHLGFEEKALPERPAGFGFLAPRGEGLRILGALFASSIFPGRAPAGHVLLTAMVGGASDPSAVELPEADLVALARRDLATAMGIEAKPVLVRVFRHPRGIAQYTLGHLDRLAAIERLSSERPGLFFCGSSYRGVSLNSCIEEAPAIARRVLEHLARRQAETRQG
jgi:oxygen-dependent protoporphyrinogen oxidase